MDHAQTKRSQRIRRHARIRARVAGTAERPRLAVYRSNTRLIAQLIDDDNGTTLVAVSSDTTPGKTPQERAQAAGTALAKAAAEKKIQHVVFDRGGFQYVGVIKLFADAVRDGGLTF